jgi:hypothetical protein
MAEFLIDFEWQKSRDGYRIVPCRPLKSGEPRPPHRLADPRLDRIEPVGGELMRLRPLDRADDLFRVFARVRTQEGLIEFFNTFGPLDELSPGGAGEEVEHVLRVAEQFREAIDLHFNRPRQVPSYVAERLSWFPLQFKFVPTPRRGPWFKLVPTSLRSALWIQLAQQLASGVRFQTCSFCHEIFLVGHGSGKRLDAKFCSDEHRVRHNSLKRSLSR